MGASQSSGTVAVRASNLGRSPPNKIIRLGSARDIHDKSISDSCSDFSACTDSNSSNSSESDSEVPLARLPLAQLINATLHERRQGTLLAHRIEG